MARFLKSRIKAKGAAPGSLIFMGTQKMEQSRIRLLKYSEDILIETEYKSVEEAFTSMQQENVNWLNIDGLHDTELVQKVGELFGISPLALENILNTGQRSKYFEDKNCVTIIAKAIYFDEETRTISSEQISFLLGKNFLISFQERVGDHFEPVRERIRNKIGRIRISGTDYLMYTLIDSLVDNYLITIEKIGSLIEDMEEKLTLPDKEVPNDLLIYKTEISFIRKTIRPLREVMIKILRSSTPLIHKEISVYFQELSDLVEQAYEAGETYYSLVGDQLNIYNTNLNNRVNAVMKVLTIFASIFIPLTFIAGIYGTNFEYLPELQFRYSYFVMWGVMVLVAISMLVYFKRNRWF